jgi:hypothetical protein
MRTLGIIGIVLSAYWMIMSLSIITEEGILMLFITFGYFLALSIMAVKDKK